MRRWVDEPRFCAPVIQNECCTGPGTAIFPEGPGVQLAVDQGLISLQQRMLSRLHGNDGAFQIKESRINTEVYLVLEFKVSKYGPAFVLRKMFLKLVFHSSVDGVNINCQNYCFSSIRVADFDKWYKLYVCCV